MKRSNGRGNALIIFLGFVVTALLVATCYFSLDKTSHAKKEPTQKTARHIFTSDSNTVSTETPAIAVASEENKPQASEESKPQATVVSKPPRANWPEITAADGRDDLGVPYTIDGTVLVNRKHPVNWDYVPAIDSAGGVILQPQAKKAYEEMHTAAMQDGIQFYFRSGYRDFATQAAIYQQYARTDPNGIAGANRYSAPPGASEHQTGLAVDIDNGSGLSYDFDQTPAGIWLHKNAYKFGFIIRFPKGKEPITGYTYEPWHFRYIGVEKAADFGPENTLTLEEYLHSEPAPAPGAPESEIPDAPAVSADPAQVN